MKNIVSHTVSIRDKFQSCGRGFKFVEANRIYVAKPYALFGKLTEM